MSKLSPFRSQYTNLRDTLPNKSPSPLPQNKKNTPSIKRNLYERNL